MVPPVQQYFGSWLYDIECMLMGPIVFNESLRWRDIIRAPHCICSHGLILHICSFWSLALYFCQWIRWIQRKLLGKIQMSVLNFWKKTIRKSFLYSSQNKSGSKNWVKIGWNTFVLLGTIVATDLFSYSFPFSISRRERLRNCWFNGQKPLIYFC